MGQVTVTGTGIRVHTITVRRGDLMSENIVVPGMSIAPSDTLKMNVCDAISSRVVLSCVPIVILSGSDPVITINKSSAQMIIRPGVYRYDVSVIRGVTDEETLIEGGFVVNNDVTMSEVVGIGDDEGRVISG